MKGSCAQDSPLISSSHLSSFQCNALCCEESQEQGWDGVAFELVALDGIAEETAQGEFFLLLLDDVAPRSGKKVWGVA